MGQGAISRAFNAHGGAEPLSIDRAIEIFDWLADMEDIPFGFAEQGCHARAHIMCRRIMAKGLSPQKAWAFEGDEMLAVAPKAPNELHLYWGYHVAPTLSVQTPAGDVQDLVFDPALFDGPVTLQQWGAVMMAPPETLQIVPFGVSPKSAWERGDYKPLRNTGPLTDDDALAEMSSYMHCQRNEKRCLLPSPLRREAEAGRLKQEGKTWISASLLPQKPPAPLRETTSEWTL